MNNILHTIVSYTTSTQTMFGDSLGGVDVGSTGIPKATDTAVLNGVLKNVYWLAGAIAVLVIVIAGIYYATADGDAAKIKQAKNAILYAVIGLVLVMAAFTITSFIAGGMAK